MNDIRSSRVRCTSADSWNRLRSTALAIGTILLVLLFLILANFDHQLANSNVAMHLGFYSIAKKYGPVSEHAIAISVALTLAFIAGTIVGTVIGIADPNLPARVRRALKGVSTLGRLGIYIVLLGMVTLPFLPLGSYDEASASDRSAAFLFTNRLTAAILVAATYVAYTMTSAFLIASIRSPLER